MMGAVLHFYFSMLSVLAPLVVCVGVGVVWGKKNYPFAAQFITVLATSVSTPALVFSTLVTAKLSNEVLANVAGATALALGLCAVACAVALKVTGQPVRKLLQTATFPNAGNLGLPISYLAFGDAGLSTAIAFFAVCSFIQHTIGVRFLPNTQGIAAPWKSPILIASVSAALCRLLAWVPPDWIIESTKLLGSLTVPLMLLSLGHALAVIPAAGLRIGSIVGTMRLLLGLAAGYAAGWLIGLPDEFSNILALQMAMPCAAVSYMYARRYTDMGDAAAGAVLVSTLSFLALAPALLWLVGSTAGLR
ncbi:membrane protein [Pigmentiphaga litoralis]|nr:membrane protein [Pigmentiphaga litoralis]